MTEKNPTPWRPDEDWYTILDPNGRAVAEMIASRELAPRIARDVNAHEALVAASRMIVSMLDGERMSYKACELARAALALVDGEET